MAATQGVKRLIFLSSVKVHGQTSVRPFTETDVAHPEDAYGVSKWEAEQTLMQVGMQTGMEWIVLRPPLVYGPDVRANFLSLLRPSRMVCRCRCARSTIGAASCTWAI